MKTTYIFLGLVLITFLTKEKVMATPDTVQIRGEKAYQLCASCHGKNGWGKPDGSFPAIAGQHQSVLLKQLEDFRNRNRDNPTMFPFSDTKTIGSEQMVHDVTRYVANLPINPNPGQGLQEDANNGKKLYETHCVACHSKDFSGNAKARFPSLRGQHYAYLKRQLIWIRDGTRRNPNPEMLHLIQELTDEQLTQLAAYIAKNQP